MSEQVTLQVAEMKRKFPRFAAAAIEDVETSTLPWQTSSPAAAHVHQTVEQLPEAGPSRSICADLRPLNRKHHTLFWKSAWKAEGADCVLGCVPYYYMLARYTCIVRTLHLHIMHACAVMGCAVLCCAVLCCAVMSCAVLCYWTFLQ